MRDDYSIFGGANPQHQLNAKAKADYGKALAGVRGPSRPTEASGVQTGFNAGRQAANSGSIMGRLGEEGGMVSASLEGDGGRAVDDLAKSQAMANQATVGRGLEHQNAQQNMKDQSTRSELLQTALANQTKQYADMAQRQVSQIGLGAALQGDLLRHSLMRK